MQEIKIYVDFNNNQLSHKKITLRQNDYNSTKFKFEFDKEEGLKKISFKFPDNTAYIEEIQNNEFVFKQGMLTQVGQTDFSISLYDENSKLTNVINGYYTVVKELVNEDEVVELDDRVPILDKLINEANAATKRANAISKDLEEKVDADYYRGEQGTPGTDGENGFSPIVNVEQTDDGANITITDKNGTTSASIYNGVDGTNGKDGYTPVKGLDYDTEEEKNDMKNAVLERVTPTLDNNLKSAKDYTDNAIIKDFKDISYNSDTATFIFTRHDNTTFTVDLPIEQTVKNGYYDEETKELVLVLVSEQEIKIPASGLIDDFTGVDSATIQLTISADNKITANIIGGSISKTLLTTELQEEINNKINKSSFSYDENTETLSINVE